MIGPGKRSSERRASRRGSLRVLAALTAFGVLAPCATVAAGAGAAGYGSEPIVAVVTRSEGVVTLSPPRPRGETADGVRAGESGGSIERLRGLQVVRAGTHLHVPRGARVGLVCANERWVELDGGSWTLTRSACERGVELPPGTFASVEPVEGRLRAGPGALAVERPTRGNEGADPTVPTVLAPRHTAVLDARPRFVWTEVEGAVEYEIEVTGVPSFRHRVAAEAADCRADTGLFEGLRVCSSSYPADRPALSRGWPVTVSVGARRSVTGRFRRELGRIRVELPADAEVLRSRLASIDAMPVDPVTRQLLAGDAAARAGALGAAIRFYGDALAASGAPLPEVRATLADLLAAQGLPALADRLTARPTVR